MSVTVSAMISVIVTIMVSIVVSVGRGEFTCGKAYMAPCTVLQVMPSMELRVSATSLARSAREARVPSTWGWPAASHGDFWRKGRVVRLYHCLYLTKGTFTGAFT